MFSRTSGVFTSEFFFIYSNVCMRYSFLMEERSERREGKKESHVVYDVVVRPSMNSKSGTAA